MKKGQEDKKERGFDEHMAEARAKAEKELGRPMRPMVEATVTDSEGKVEDVPVEVVDHELTPEPGPNNPPTTMAHDHSGAGPKAMRPAREGG